MMYFKGDYDILQGISKLDNLLKISKFQVYKKGYDEPGIKKSMCMQSILKSEKRNSSNMSTRNRSSSKYAWVLETSNNSNH